MPETTPEPATPKGRRTRLAMVEAAAALMYERGIAATTVDEILAASGTGKSQLYHYFGGKQAVVIAVLRYQFERVMGAQPALTDESCSDPGRWRAEVLAAHRAHGFGSCPLGVFAGQVDSEPALRAVLAALFDRWQAAIAALLRRATAAGRLPAATDPDTGGLVLLGALQGGTLLSHLRGEPRPLADALDHALAELGYSPA